MEWLIILGIAGAAVWLVLKWLAFVHFKSQLMNAFGREGIDHETADMIYTVHSKTINTLYGQGMPPSLIARLALEGSYQNRGAAHSTAPSESYVDPDQGQPEERRESRGLDQKIERIIKFVVGILTTQSILMRNASGQIASEAIDDWALGYVHGQYDAALQREGVPFSDHATQGLFAVMEALFGEERAAVVERRYSKLLIDRPTEFVEGMLAGGQDVYNFLHNNENYPLAWSNRYHDIVASSHT